MNAGALLAESIRVAVSGLRAIASALEEALSRFDRLQNESGTSVDLERAAAPCFVSCSCLFACV